MSTTTKSRLTSFGLELDQSAAAFGELRRSSALANDGEALRAQMRADGYLYMPGVLDRDEVLAARRFITDRLATGGMFDENHPSIEAVYKAGGRANFGHHPAAQSPPLAKVLYAGAMLAFYERLLGGPVRHYDFTWLRTSVPGSPATYPHCDIVYMGRGTFNLFTSWTPLGDVPVEMGGLMILEGGHRQRAKLDHYLQRDVDAYCTNRADAPLIEAGEKLWQDWDGRLASSPVALREKLGGRWLTADFRAGDFLAFTMATIHASLDNHSNRVRLSSDSRYQLASEPVDERWVGAQPVGHGPAGKRGKIC